MRVGHSLAEYRDGPKEGGEITSEEKRPMSPPSRKLHASWHRILSRKPVFARSSRR